MSSLARIKAIGYRIGVTGFTPWHCIFRQGSFLRSVHPRYMFRLLLVVATSLFITPFCWWEKARFGRQIARIHLESSPVFIIGHWRSGTTHLHNLMSQDSSFGCLSMYQTLVPECSQVCRRWLKPLLARIVPGQRLMDSMVCPMDSPQEDEVALAKMIPYSFYGWFLFPCRAVAMFNRYVLLNGAPPAMVTELERTYKRLLQIATLYAGGRQLLLKNPVNTARVRLLLRLFPDAKFVHIYRSPYNVYPSTLHLYGRSLEVLALQKVTPGYVEEVALQVYEKLMRRYLEDRPLIPSGNLVEICYEDLERDPEPVVKRIYDTLGLPGYEAAAPAIRAYIGSVRSYRKNRFELTEEECRLIGKRWRFAFDEFGYARSADGPVGRLQRDHPARAAVWPD